MQRRNIVALFVIALFARDATARPELADYRYFRALSIDLLGRPPSRDEIVQFEQPDFSESVWIAGKLQGPRYAERIRRIYADQLRLELPDSVATFAPPSIMLRWTTIQGPDGRLIDLYFRNGQRRVKPSLDGQVCFTADEIGVQIPFDGAPIGTPKRISSKLLDERTVVVRPWWLYADYAAPLPQDRAGPSWIQRFGYELLWSLFTEPDGKTAMTGVRVCREEAQIAASGRVFITGRIVRKSDPIPLGRLSRAPGDTSFATENAGRTVSCVTSAGYESSVQCGCGVGLERCLPAGPNGFMTPWEAPLGLDAVFSSSARPATLWLRAWWSQEAVRFIDQIFEQDRDVRELLVSRATVINGPLAQFYRYFANATCCAPASELGYSQPEALFEPAAVPGRLAPHEVKRWVAVADRGPNAAGILTMPIFLLKYGSNRQRAHAIYKTFLCKEFVAERVELAPSTEPDLTRRAGCAACHRRLDPMAAYFARIRDSDWTFLPASALPMSNAQCLANDSKTMSPACRALYDPDFTTARQTVLRGAYGSPNHADRGPRGLASDVTSSPAFAPCVVRTVAQSLLGRPLTAEDDVWKATLVKNFVDGGYRMRPLVREILTSVSYRDTADHLIEAR